MHRGVDVRVQKASCLQEVRRSPGGPSQSARVFQLSCRSMHSPKARVSVGSPMRWAGGSTQAIGILVTRSSQPIRALKRKYQQSAQSPSPLQRLRPGSRSLPWLPSHVHRRAKDNRSRSVSETFPALPNRSDTPEALEMRQSALCGRSSIAFSALRARAALTLRVVVGVGRGRGRSMG